MKYEDMSLVGTLVAQSADYRSVRLRVKEAREELGKLEERERESLLSLFHDYLTLKRVDSEKTASEDEECPLFEIAGWGLSKFETDLFFSASKHITTAEKLAKSPLSSEWQDSWSLDGSLLWVAKFVPEKFEEDTFFPGGWCRVSGVNPEAKFPIIVGASYGLQLEVPPDTEVLLACYVLAETEGK